MGLMWTVLLFFEILSYAEWISRKDFNFIFKSLFRPKTFNFKSDNDFVKKIMETASVKALVLLKTKGNEFSEQACRRVKDLLTYEDKMTYTSWLAGQVRITPDAAEEQPSVRIDTNEEEAGPEEVEGDASKQDDRFERRR